MIWSRPDRPGPRCRRPAASSERSQEGQTVRSGGPADRSDALHALEADRRSGPGDRVDEPEWPAVDPGSSEGMSVRRPGDLVAAGTRKLSGVARAHVRD